MKCESANGVECRRGLVGIHMIQLDDLNGRDKGRLLAKILIGYGVELADGDSGIPCHCSRCPEGSPLDEGIYVKRLVPGGERWVRLGLKWNEAFFSITNNGVADLDDSPPPVSGQNAQALTFAEVVFQATRAPGYSGINYEFSPDGTLLRLNGEGFALFISEKAEGWACDLTVTWASFPAEDMEGLTSRMTRAARQGQRWVGLLDDAKYHDNIMKQRANPESAKDQGVA